MLRQQVHPTFHKYRRVCLQVDNVDKGDKQQRNYLKSSYKLIWLNQICKKVFLIILIIWGRFEAGISLYALSGERFIDPE